MKPWWKSRILWLSAIVALCPYVPYVREWVKQDPIHVMQYHAMMIYLLRLDTKRIIGKESEEG